MSKRVTLALHPEHALQYAAMFEALAQNGPSHPVFRAMFEDLRDKLTTACADQMSWEEIDRCKNRHE